MNLRHNVKKQNKSINTFHYLTRTAHFKNQKDNEKLEFVKSGNMPDWAKNKPAVFWGSADKFEIARGRTSSTLTIALPNDLSKEQRIELVKNLIENFTGQHKLPYTAAVHNHPSEITDEDQPHLHLMYSERTIDDDIERFPEQFFKQYRPKNPTRGGAQKLTADALGYGKNQVQIYRKQTEEIINESLAKYVPMKQIVINGLQLEVENIVSCLSNADYNKKFGTNLQDVPQIVRWKLHSSDPIIKLEVEAQKETIKAIRLSNIQELYGEQYRNELNRINKLTVKNNISFGFD